MRKLYEANAFCNLKGEISSKFPLKAFIVFPDTLNQGEEFGIGSFY